MIAVINEDINGIPSLVVVESDKEKQPLPVIVYFHGITSAKEHNLDTAFLLAQKGFRVILPDAMHHGERENGISPVKRTFAFWDMVIQNVKELETMKDYLENKGLIDKGRLGVAGTSMGGITTAAALRKYQWIKVAAIMMGSPKLTKFTEELVENYRNATQLPVTDEEIQQLYERVKEYDLSREIEQLNQRPLLLWHGEEDNVVPFNHSLSFYEEARELYNDSDRIRHIREANRDHKVSRPAKLELVEWFRRYL
ncbi:esterase [Oceanobacillus piezotolerans]|uniref:Esterase n=1 Tax=Oceanobacillus piezotolerans TaxID=2448030 RepID=A0A498DBE1_9BACI|nr:esterase [Oceanobacillus piezotolerans]RLL45053.1 esterase [Oceanobacillus piezotolerans]